MSKQFIARQGDVMIVSVDEIPAQAKRVIRDNGRVILAYGEVTGHAHQVMERPGVPMADDDAVLLSVAENATFLRLTKKAQLIHEEHDPVDLPKGMYRVIRQIEHTPWGEKRVAD